MPLGSTRKNYYEKYLHPKNSIKSPLLINELSSQQSRNSPKNALKKSKYNMSPNNEVSKFLSKMEKTLSD